MFETEKKTYITDFIEIPKGPFDSFNLLVVATKPANMSVSGISSLIILNQENLEVV